MAFQTALAWTLVHSLWEGTAAALVLFPLLLVVRSAKLRYAAARVALLAVGVAFAVTLARMTPGEDAFRVGGSIPLPPPAASDAGTMASLGYEFGLRTMLRWLVPFWIAGVVLFHARNLVSLVGTRRLRHRGVCQAARDWQVRLTELRAAVRCRGRWCCWSHRWRLCRR
jgi:hypothetical protein